MNADTRLVAVNNEVKLSTLAFGSVAFTLKGTWVGTVTFECSGDGATWDAFNVLKSDGTTATTTATANGTYTAAVGGLLAVRARCSAFTSGVIECIGHAIQIGSAPVPTGVVVTSIPSHPVTNAGVFLVQPQAYASGGWTPGRLISAATTNATSVKASAGQLGFMVAINLNAAVRYLKFYNKASAPTVGSDTPIQTYAIPGDTTGAGFSIPFGPGLTFTTGIAFALTTGVADGDTGAVAANEILLNYGWL